MNFILVEEEQSETWFVHISAISMAVDFLEQLFTNLAVYTRQFRDRIRVAVTVAPLVHMVPRGCH